VHALLLSEWKERCIPVACVQGMDVRRGDAMQDRILQLRFDNVVRVNVAGPEHAKAKTRQQIELADSKSKEGLADEYAKEYHTAVAGVAEDRHAKTRMVCIRPQHAVVLSPSLENFPHFVTALTFMSNLSCGDHFCCYPPCNGFLSVRLVLKERINTHDCVRVYIKAQ
jgi:hypothetical protein